MVPGETGKTQDVIPTTAILGSPIWSMQQVDGLSIQMLYDELYLSQLFMRQKCGTNYLPDGEFKI